MIERLKIPLHRPANCTLVCTLHDKRGPGRMPIICVGLFETDPAYPDAPPMQALWLTGYIITTRVDAETNGQHAMWVDTNAITFVASDEHIAQVRAWIDRVKALPR